VDVKKPAGVIGWLALSAVLPGAAHLRAGWTRTGLALLGTYLGIVLTGFGVATTADAGLAGRALSWLTAISVLAWAAALGWFVLIVHSFVVLRPWRLPRKGQILTGAVAGVLALVTAAPFVITAQYVTVSQRTLEQMFGGSAESIGDPWSGRDRVNVLLVGGDADDNRVGIRTDSVNVASVDVRTGDTVVFGLPRNLEDVRFPPGSPMHARFPDGFRLPVGAEGGREDLLFSVWEYADEHPELFGGRQGMGAQTLKETVGYTLGLKIDWYALVNIWGFARIVDALGGLVLTVDRDVVFGRYNEGLVRAGTRRLGGAEALWFASLRALRLRMLRRAERDAREPRDDDAGRDRRVRGGAQDPSGPLRQPLADVVPICPDAAPGADRRRRLFRISFPHRMPPAAPQAEPAEVPGRARDRRRQLLERHAARVEGRGAARSLRRALQDPRGR
jgi:anionic cell wall polymer biosynthesis LytR-Cps2A-Psr (LCP) family protein